MRNKALALGCFRILRAFLVGAALVSVLTSALAQAPLRIVVPSPPGGPQDNLARVLARQLSATMGEPVIVDNRPGADSAIATEYVVNMAQPDRTLLMSSSYLALGAVLGQFRFDPLVDLKPVVKAVDMDIVLVARSGLPVHTAADLARYSREGYALSCGGGIGQMFLACQLLKSHLGQNFTAVRFNGISKLTTYMMGGHVDVGFLPTHDARPHVNSGRLKALAVGGRGNTDKALAHLPLIVATWPDIELKSYMGLYAPKSASDTAIARWNSDINAALLNEEVVRSLETLEMRPAGGGPQLLGATLAQELARFKRFKTVLESK